MCFLEISNHPARTTHATRRAGPGVGAPLQWRGTDSATGRRPSSPLRRGGTKCRGGLFHCAGDGGEAACGTCGCSDTYGEWSSPDTNGVVRRTVTRYSNAARYYSCDATTETQTSCGDTYYGNGTKCTRCPSYILTIGTTIRNMPGKSIIGDNTSITDCYMPAGISSRDNTGYFSYEQNCPYSKGFGQL